MIGGHGGNIFELARRLNCTTDEIIDLSSNVNPLGPLPALVDHLTSQIDVMACLPEADAGRIIRAFARHHGLDADTLLAGNGSTQFIYTLPLALQLKRVLIAGPTYADYHDACRAHGAVVTHWMARDSQEFTPDPDALVQAATDMDALFLCNPNNPTGARLPRESIQELCLSCPDTLIVLDESYLPFVTDGEAQSLFSWNCPNLIVLNSLSKIFRIPGLRIGFVKAPAAIIEKINRYMQPWSVNSLAQTAVAYLMANRSAVDGFVARTRRFLEEQRRYLAQRLHQIPGLHCFPSQTSFLLIRLGRGMTANKVCGQLAQEKILIRDCTNFKGLGEAYIRISLKGEAENRLVADRLEHLMES